MTATLAAVTLALSLQAACQISGHSHVDHGPGLVPGHHHGTPYRDRLHFWGRPLVARPVVDPYADKHPTRIEKANERILPPGPGFGWGFRNSAPDGYGWYDPGETTPLGFQADRTPDYYFRRQFALPAQQMFFPTYYNGYVMRGQRYIPYTNCGGFHPSGGAPSGSSLTPVEPYALTASERPVVTPPTYAGAQAAPALPAEPVTTEDFERMP